MRTTTYRAPDKRRGYRAGEIAGILSRHYPESTVVVRVGWAGQPQQLIVTEPDLNVVTDEQVAAEVDAFNRRAADHEAGCKIPPPLPPNVQDMLTVQEIARATAAEELVREELLAEGVDVAAVERAARRAHDRGLGGAL